MQQQKEKDKEKKEKHVQKKELKKKSEKSQATEQLTKRYLKCWQILERMINQNIYDDIAQGWFYLNLVYWILNRKYIFCRLSLLRGSIGWLPWRRGNPFAAVAILLWQNKETECDRHLLQHALLRFVCRLLWVMYVILHNPLWTFVDDFIYFQKLTLWNKDPRVVFVYLPWRTHRFRIIEVSYLQLYHLVVIQVLCLAAVMTESGVMCCDIHPTYCYLLVIGEWITYWQ